MKKLLLSLTLLTGIALRSVPASAQLANGSIAPDWTLTDIDGNTWHLYDLLDSNVTVFIDVFAVWCGPCWSYHNTGNLDALYEDYGPYGTGEVMVFQIEGDGGSTLDQMNGIGAGTQGNWVAGTTYPSILTHVGQPSYDVVYDYDIAYFPTIYRICPNRVIKEVGQASETVLYNSVGECEMAYTNVDPAIMDYTGPTVGCSEVDLSVTIQNMGFDPLTSCIIKAFNGATELLSYNWSGSLNIYDMADVNIGSVVLPSDDTDVDITITSADDNTLNNTVTANISYFDNVSMVVHLTITTDNYPTQTHWEIINESTGATVADGGPYNNAQKNMVVFDEDITLPGLGCYTLHFYDTGGDGLTGSASFKLSNDAGGILATGTENIGYEKSEAMKVTGINAIHSENTVDAMQAYPVPADASVVLEIDLPSAQNLSISIVDILGRTMSATGESTLAAGAHHFTLNTADLADGIYFIKIDGTNLHQSQQFTVAH